mgnify:CR=1 FL=1
MSLEGVKVGDAVVRLNITETGWTLHNADDERVYPTHGEAHWAIGPIEVARVLWRLGFPVQINIEPKDKAMKK